MNHAPESGTLAATPTVNSSDIGSPSAKVETVASPIEPRTIGITGGIGMGKTTVSDYLKTRHNLPILDADIYARAAVEPGSRVLAELVERYGSSILLPSGKLDRERLGNIIFASSAERHWLEQQIHPYVRERLETELQVLKAQGCQTIVLVIPLLFEARMTDLVSEIWVVRLTEAEQTQRLRQRDQLSLEQAQARINSQMPIEKKVAQADVVLDNSSTPEALFQQIEQVLSLRPAKQRQRRH
jgi:dephospho-CoA kinase